MTTWCGSGPGSEDRTRSERRPGPEWVLGPLLADPSLVGVGFAIAYADAADRWIQDLIGPPRDGVALVAVGGYGRRHLCPGSDLDLTLVHDGGMGRDIEALADRLWYPLWDAGVRVDHSVRTLRDALRLAENEVEVASGLLDARLVWGDASLAANLEVGARERWRRLARRRLPELAELVEARHRANGDVAFLLEPDLKAARGGLRDVDAIRAAALGTPVVNPPASLDDAADVLLAARVELHRSTGRAADRLVLEEQERVARTMGMVDADELMVVVARAARTVGRASDDAWRRVRSWVEGPRGRQGSADRALGAGLARRDDEIVLVSHGGDLPDPAADPSLSWRVAAASAELGAPIARATAARLAERQPVQGARWPDAARQALLALLGTGPAAIPVFEDLDELGILPRLLPEWAPVRSRPQRNALHRFTVDRHLCEAAAEAAARTRRVHRPDLLLVGAWLHDIGKGSPGDHTTVGREIVRCVSARMGFAPSDVDTLVAMVELHLLLPDVATRRDLDDPATIDGVARRVATRELLELLHCLAEADGLATGPAAWSDWKAGLVAELVSRVDRRLAGAPQPAPGPPLQRALGAVPSSHRDAVTKALSAGRLAVIAVPDSPVLAIIAPDRPGLLSMIAATFVVERLRVLSARCATSPDGIALDVFEAEHERGEPIDQDRVEHDLALVLDGRLPIGARVDERVRAYAGRGGRAAAPLERRVLFEPSADSTVVEVRAPDDAGLLHRVAGALARCRLDVTSAKVATLGHEVVDAFVVTDRGAPLAPSRWPEVEAEVQHALTGPLA